MLKEHKINLHPKKAFRVWQRNLTVYRKLYKSSLIVNFVEPMIYLLAIGIGLGAYVKEINGVPYLNFIAPGILASSAMFAASFECTYGSFVRMTYQKTFDAILATPVNIEDLVLGELLWGTTKSVIYGSIILVVIAAFGLVESPLVIFLPLILIVSGLLFAEIAMIFTSISPGIDTFNYFFTLFMTPMFLFSGIFFPLDGLPPIIGQIAEFTPLYHLVNVCRSLTFGKAMPLMDILYLLAAASILLYPPIALIRRRLIK
ncbi:MAG: ABC transporter permease [Nitrospirae bacterium]|nr:ABC transporter permease [Nitrospirota bacterium]